MKKTTFLFALSLMICWNAKAQDGYAEDYELPDLQPGVENGGMTIINNTACEVALDLTLVTGYAPYQLKTTKVIVPANGTIMYSNTQVSSTWWPLGPPPGPWGFVFVPYMWSISTGPTGGPYVLAGSSNTSVNPLAPTTICVSNPSLSEPCDCFCVTTNTLHDHSTAPTTVLGVVVVIGPCP